MVGRCGRFEGLIDMVGGGWWLWQRTKGEPIKRRKESIKNTKHKKHNKLISNKAREML